MAWAKKLINASLMLGSVASLLSITRKCSESYPPPSGVRKKSANDSASRSAYFNPGIPAFWYSETPTTTAQRCGPLLLSRFVPVAVAVEAPPETFALRLTPIDLEKTFPDLLLIDNWIWLYPETTGMSSAIKSPATLNAGTCPLTISVIFTEMEYDSISNHVRNFTGMDTISTSALFLGLSTITASSSESLWMVPFHTVEWL